MPERMEWWSVEVDWKVKPALPDDTPCTNVRAAALLYSRFLIRNRQQAVLQRVQIEADNIRADSTADIRYRKTLEDPFSRVTFPPRMFADTFLRGVESGPKDCDAGHHAY